jgi:uncharacterized caspase-like protein
VKGKAYIIGMGVNANENENFRLRYAANDVRETLASVASRLRASGRYSSVIEIPLISDYQTVNGKTTLVKNATKDAFRAVIERLSGKIPQLPASLSGVPNAALIQKSTPDDMVLISFAGHGYADQEGVFYMVPYDIGGDSRKGLAEARGRCISSVELSSWMRDLDAADLMLIVDACHSAAAVEGKDFKPGPMGSRGLGQLSYDKGMQILAAAQKNDYAIESQKLEHGLLTYALVREGIENGLADHQPKDKRITATEWLLYGLRHVPELYQAMQDGKLTLMKSGEPMRGADLVGELAASGRQKNADIQQPALFDFLWKRREVVLANLQ